MFGYRHAFHAGNFADVCKHVTLVVLLQALQRKEKPYFFLDTHAAIGRYDLLSDAGQKTGEYRGGIERLWEVNDAPREVLDYLAAVRAMNPDGRLRFYPGSPRLARHFLRAQDRMAACELLKADFDALKVEFAGDRQVAVHLQDGYQGLRAFLPPKERRGLVHIDPAFERDEEYERVVEGLKAAYRRWTTGTYALWYPLHLRATAGRFHDAVAATGIRKVLKTEICVRPPTDRQRLNGSGMLIVNPPWQAQERLTQCLSWLWRRLAEPGGGEITVDWLVPE